MNLPDFTLPSPLAAIGRRLPQQPPTLMLIAALNLALGRILPRDTLQPLLGRRLRLRVTDAGITLRFVLTERGFRPSFDGVAADLSISARVRDFLALALREEDADTLFFSRRLLMEGDTELGLLVKNTLDAVEMPTLRLADLAPQRVAGRLAARLVKLRFGG
jgi:predicted lipid carrier protein YhbT